MANITHEQLIEYDSRLIIGRDVLSDAPQIGILSDQLTLTPYVGLNVKGHLLGEYSVTAKALGETEKETRDLFDEDEMYDEPFKRFIVGWQIGATFTYNRVSLGVSYGSDLTEISDDVKFATTAITLGVNF